MNLLFFCGWIVFQILVGFNLVLPLDLYLICFFRNRKAIHHPVNGEFDYALIVTAYEQTTLLPSVVDSILKLNYKNYMVYIVADKCDISSLQFTDERVVLLRPEETLASNTKSHFYAINHFKGHMNT